MKHLIQLLCLFMTTNSFASSFSDRAQEQSPTEDVYLADSNFYQLSLAEIAKLKHKHREKRRAIIERNSCVSDLYTYKEKEAVEDSSSQYSRKDLILAACSLGCASVCYYKIPRLRRAIGLVTGSFVFSQVAADPIRNILLRYYNDLKRYFFYQGELCFCKKKIS